MGEFSVRAEPPGENASESATEITAQRHALTPDSPDFEPIRCKSTARSEANCQFFPTTEQKPSHHRHGNSKSCPVMHKSGPKRQGQRGLKRRHHFVVQAGRSEQQPRMGAGMDWIGITVLYCTYTSIGTQSACVCIPTWMVFRLQSPFM
ncbi:Hypothetical protein NCS54_00342300 [Fusarium falciforme]|uniref:Hypothetical protein n=1 Tax=Fusarium falciforme TaxID=195108 RepID=UPI002301A4D3|nr:Hypothetical protein NCS54_00342300 [Fusarium falciforme]WAO86162.1 Hypothetical protein NCS54_00342300 [Fusarium falciforme]